MRASEITNQNNLLTVAFPALANGVLGFSTDMCATVMLRMMRDFITKNFNLLLKIIRIIVNNNRLVKTFTRIMMTKNYLEASVIKGLKEMFYIFIKISVKGMSH